MYKILFASLFATLLFTGCSTEQKPEIPEHIKSDMRKNANEFMSVLKDVLVSEIQQNGLAAAVSVCSDTAQIMTNNYSVEKGVFLKRVSFKNRNENNSPDLFETEGLKYFQEILNEEKLDSLTEYYGIVEKSEIKYIRYMKPILVQAPCLNCHGMKEQINPEVLDIIQSRYKNDKAINYQLGELRGAVSIEKVY